MMVTCVYVGGRFQNLEQSCISTSSQIPHGNTAPFILVFSSWFQGVMKGNMEKKLFKQ